MRTFPILFLVACGYSPATPGTGDDVVDPPPDGPPIDEGCPDGKAGAACVLALYDAAAGCDAAIVDELRAELDQRAGQGPLWADGRALFRTEAVRAIAGSFNDWS